MGKRMVGLLKWDTYSTRAAGVAILFNPKLIPRERVGGGGGGEE